VNSNPAPGVQRLAHGSLRHDRNVIALTGIELDYDGERHAGARRSGRHRQPAVDGDADGRYRGCAMTRDVGAVVNQIRPILAGRPPEMQGAILADLLAIWLAGLHVAGDVAQTRKLRAEMLAMHVSTVEELTAVNAEILGTPS
jgi:hypothetical protein